jgi:hypothetical protein
MDVKTVPRWGPRNIRGGPEESQRLLLDDPDEDEKSRSRPIRSTRVRKAKVEDSFSDEDDNLIPLGPASRPPRPLPVPDQCIEVRLMFGSYPLKLKVIFNSLLK